MEKRSWIWPTIMAVGLIIVAAILGQAYQSRNYHKSVTVTGSSQQDITSDVVLWTGTISRTVGPDGLKQGSAQIKQDSQAMQSFFQKHGIQQSEITMQPLMATPTYNNEQSKDGAYTQVFTGYSLSQGFQIESNNLDKVNNTISSSGDLLDQGILFQANPPQYLYSKLADLKVQMVSDASKDAMTRAAAIAKNAGTKLAGLDSANVGVIQITPKNSPDLSAEGMYDTSSIEKQVTVVIHSTFLLK